MQLFGRLRLNVALIRREHRRETVGGFENDFRELPSSLLTNLRGENIFQFVREFAELVVAASSGIALERVHGAANATNHFVIGRPSLEFEARVIQRLQ